MKIGSTAVVGLQVAIVCLFGLTQGCVTTESQGSGRGAGAKHKGPFRHEYKGKTDDTSTILVADPYGYSDDGASIYDSPMITDSTSSSYVEPYPSSSSTATEIYIVQKGDILSQLAVDFDTTTAMLVQLNGLSNPDVLYVGQELRVPAGRGAAKTTSKPSGSIKKGGSYTIQKGDTLSEIALAAGVTIDDLRQLNDIKGDKIMAGETLDIPSYGKVPSSTRSSSSSSSKKKSESTSTPAPEPAPAPAALAPEPAAPVIDEPVVEPVVEDTMSVGIIEDKVLYPGETLDDVARQYGVSKAEIMRLNNISDESQVQEGMRLRIPIAE